jgi:SAM-dependent methyltransferase
MGHTFDAADAEFYDAWMNRPEVRRAVEAEGRMALSMLRFERRDRLLDIGCGDGCHLNVFLAAGLSVTALEPSTCMRKRAWKRVGDRVDFYPDVAEDLPFDDNEFDHVTLMKTLEFVDDPEKALREAGRVAKNRLFVSILNPYSAVRLRIDLESAFTNNSVFRHARFLGPRGLIAQFRSAFGDVPIRQRCTDSVLSGKLSKVPLLRRAPLGIVLGFSVDLIPRFRVRPLLAADLEERKNGVPAAVCREKPEAPELFPGL